MIEASALATTVVTSFLVPYLVKGLKTIGEEAAKSLGGEVGKKVAGVAENVWKKVTGVFQSDREKFALEDFEKNPEEDAQRMIRLLKEKLESDEAFAKELQELVTTPIDSTDQSPVQIMNAGIAGVVQIGTVGGSGHQIGGVIINRDVEVDSLANKPQPKDDSSK